MLTELAPAARADGAAESAAGSAAVALGHHADDQVETLLLKALRGCHISNLAGMQWRHGIFVRPLLGVRKEDLVAHMRAIGQSWMEDASNADVDAYKRNRVRHQLVPLLQQMSGGALLSRLNAAEEQSAQLREWLEQASAEHVAGDSAWQGSPRGLSVGALRQQPELLRGELVRLLARDAAGDDLTLPYATVRRLLAQLESGGAEWSIDVAATWTVRREGGVLRMAPASGAASHPLAIGATLGGGGDGGTREVDVCGVRLTLPDTWSVRGGRDECAPDTALVLDGVADGDHLTLRAWQSGDRFQPAWRRSAISVSQFLRGQNVPLESRRTVPLLCEGDGPRVLAIARAPGGKDAEGDQAARASWYVGARAASSGTTRSRLWLAFAARRASPSDAAADSGQDSGC